MTPSSPGDSVTVIESPSARRTALVATIVVAMFVVAMAESGARAWLNAEARSQPFTREKQVTLLPQNPEHLPPVATSPCVLMIGNSHTYALPGLRYGEPMRQVGGPVVIDELCTLRKEKHGSDTMSFWLLSYPNFLPTEILLRVVQLLDAGRQPDLVIFGVTWRNVGRDHAIRSRIQSLLTRPAVAELLFATISSSKSGATSELFDVFQQEVRKLSHAAESERVRSAADKLDERVTDWLEQHSTLLGDGNELRARIIRDLWMPFLSFILQARQESYTYEVIPSDYELNFQALEVTLRQLRERGIPVLCYYAPERSDLPLLLPLESQRHFMERFERLAHELDTPVVDARSVVPAEMWGWDTFNPDRSHFTEPGHRLLAEFLDREIQTRRLWPPMQDSRQAGTVP